MTTKATPHTWSRREQRGWAGAWPYVKIEDHRDRWTRSTEVLGENRQTELPDENKKQEQILFPQEYGKGKILHTLEN